MTSMMFPYSFYAQLGPWIHVHASVYVTLWWFLRPLVSGSHLSLEEYMIWIFCELTSRIISVFGDSADAVW